MARIKPINHLTKIGDNIMTRQNLISMTQDQINALNKADLQNHLNAAIELLKSAKSAPENSRKSQVVRLLLEKPTSIYDMAAILDTTNKNVSSVLCGLKKDGLDICTNGKSEKFFADIEQAKLYLDNPESIQIIE